jgi:hypothetical protein
MSMRIDQSLSAKFQACCLNYNTYIKNVFGSEYGIEKHLMISLQFCSITQEQSDDLENNADLPAGISEFIEGFHGALTTEEYNDPRFAYRVMFVAKTANHRSQADEVIEFIKPGSDLAKEVNTKYALIKETERKKLVLRGIVWGKL